VEYKADKTPLEIQNRFGRDKLKVIFHNVLHILHVHSK